MKFKMTEIVEQAAQIIMNSGIENLTVKNLAKKMVVDEDELSLLFSNDDHILLLIFENFEKELKEFILELSRNNDPPEKEFKTFFKHLYNLFLQKPFYLSIIFDKGLKNRDERIKKSIIRMKDIVENYLTQLINIGKLHNSFKTKKPTRVLVGRMLVEFRMLMRDEQYLNEMILQMNTLKDPAGKILKDQKS
ncbi:MAG: hypothetical protein V2I54_09280 [Bacteroidales bacterium]|nr:hypothetical protein [Bacteroidales bacterium]